jgi:hypothetical protein
MDKCVTLIDEYETTKKRLDSLRQNMMENHRLYKSVAMSLFPDLFETHQTVEAEKVYLDYILEKYKNPDEAFNRDYFSAGDLGLRGKGIRAEMNGRMSQTLSLFYGNLQRRRRELIKSKKRHELKKSRKVKK